MKYSRIIIVVLDGFGAGLLPEADHNVQNKSSFEDIIDSIGLPQIPTLKSLGFLNMTEKYGDEKGKFSACYGKMRVQSPFKDSWAGHWELAGWRMNNNMDTSYWTNGFSSTIVQQFEKDIKL